VPCHRRRNAAGKRLRSLVDPSDCCAKGDCMTSSLIILVVIVGLVFWGISIYNGLVAMRQRVSQAFADVDVQLKQRHDLVPNLVETVKGYATHERETLD